VRDEYNVVHRLWPVTDARTIEIIQRELADKKLVIADGHHRMKPRWPTATNAGRAPDARNANAPYEKSHDDSLQHDGKGLTILPTHRVVANVPDFSFDSFHAASCGSV